MNGFENAFLQRPNMESDVGLLSRKLNQNREMKNDEPNIDDKIAG